MFIILHIPTSTYFARLTSFAIFLEVDSPEFQFLKINKFDSEIEAKDMIKTIAKENKPLLLCYESHDITTLYTTDSFNLQSEYELMILEITSND